jgi:hypothetical membrane protein
MQGEKPGSVIGIIGILLPIIMIFIIYGSITMVPEFSWTENAISDLGASGVPSATFFNFGIMITGFLLLIFTIGVSDKLFGDSGLRRVGSWIMGLSSLFLILIAIYPLPVDLHFYVSYLFFILFPLSFLIIGVSNFRNENNFKRRLSYFAFLVVLIAVFSLGLVLIFEGEAVSEVLAALPGFIWLMIFGIGVTSGIDT